ncbi:Phosphatidylinositide phosphatase SAC1 [Phytophthora cinnamomi]|uniref:Phosphatidylinositide phosphatase SAC1 n=1 Tax=Phytophthora cinnamomi TaxID=4785 RepID=UPI00355A0040|nr:Phosphatidylinositide phosphatase SAC1 [Phytophthora cinnamomi]
MFKVYAERSELLLEDCRAGAGPWLRLSANASSGGVDIEQLAGGGAQPTVRPMHVHTAERAVSGGGDGLARGGLGPNSEKIYCILELALLPVSAAARQSFKHASAREKQDEREYCRMLTSALASRTFYFSYDLDRSRRRSASASSSSAAQRQSPLYARGGGLLLEQARAGALHRAGAQRLDRARHLGLRQGHQEVRRQRPALRHPVLHAEELEARGHALQRAGRRQGRCVANFAETEMLLVKPSRAVCSYVQVRGSIPLYWDQMVTLKYMPRTRYASRATSVVDWNELAFRAHMDNLIQRYGHITCVNLIDKAGKSATVRDQAQLGSAFGKYVKKYNQLSKSGDGTSSVGSAAASPMPASPALHALSLASTRACRSHYPPFLRQMGVMDTDPRVGRFGCRIAD